MAASRREQWQRKSGRTLHWRGCETLKSVLKDSAGSVSANQIINCSPRHTPSPELFTFILANVKESKEESFKISLPTQSHANHYSKSSEFFKERLQKWTEKNCPNLIQDFKQVNNRGFCGMQTGDLPATLKFLKTFFLYLEVKSGRFHPVAAVNEATA